VLKSGWAGICVTHFVYTERSETRTCFINVALEYAIKKAQTNKNGLQLNCTHQLPVSSVELHTSATCLFN